ncbi:heterokaryon incompatibility protein-domain-containing protein [Bisporella sp. PMI_857]|nr:heterokaryon incompatibility protein-domain-containing protein [Bisporella sp. PMI_857]
MPGMPNPYNLPIVADTISASDRKSEQLGPSILDPQAVAGRLVPQRLNSIREVARQGSTQPEKISRRSSKATPRFTNEQGPKPLDPSCSIGAHSIHSSIPQIQLWLQTCLETHWSCRSALNSRLPARVLDVGQTDVSKIFLVEPQDNTAYICLSYSWGKSEFLKLTTKNLQACRGGILVDSLPTSFQHAIELARRLEVRYIWIDALCILQNDQRDWEIEGSKMADIYQSSLLTIAMTNGSNPDQDCLPKIEIDTIDSIQARLVYHFLDHFLPNSFYFPLTERAWAFQERLLAPRVLHFGPHELFWECLSGEKCECGRIVKFRVNKQDCSYLLIQEREDGPGVQLDRFWRSIVEFYSNHNLTFKADRLPALAGIAAAMQNVRHGTYLAGLWSDSLALDLLWRPSADIGTRLSSSPSWSWATIDGPVEYWPFSKDAQTNIKCEIEDFDCEPEGISMTGRIKSGWIQLKSSMLECCLLTDGSIVLADKGEFLRRKRNFEGVCFSFDTATEDQEFVFYILRMTSWQRGEIPAKKGYYGEDFLLLRPVDESGRRFERIGFAGHEEHVLPLDWSAEELHVITIV